MGWLKECVRMCSKLVVGSHDECSYGCDDDSTFSFKIFLFCFSFELEYSHFDFMITFIFWGFFVSLFFSRFNRGFNFNLRHVSRRLGPTTMIWGFVEILLARIVPIFRMKMSSWYDPILIETGCYVRHSPDAVASQHCFTEKHEKHKMNLRTMWKVWPIFDWICSQHA